MWQWGLWLQFVGGRIRQHGGDFGVVGLSIHNYSGTTFVSWNYYKASLITEFFKGFGFSRGEVSAGRLGFTENSYNLGAGSIRDFLWGSSSSKGCLSAGNYLCCGDLLGWKGKIETFSEDRCLRLCEWFGGKVHYPLV